MKKIILILMIIILLFICASCGDVTSSVQKCIEQGDLDKAWSKATTDETKQMVIDTYLAKGNYEEAYEKSLTEDDKLAVKVESNAAAQSSVSADNLKNPSSFSLRDVYYEEMENDKGKRVDRLILNISGMNGFGGTTSSYWLYMWDTDKNGWSYFTTVSDLDDEEYKSYDDANERTKKAWDNIGRAMMRTTISDGIKLSKLAVSRINTLFEENILDTVTAIDITR